MKVKFLKGTNELEIERGRPGVKDTTDREPYVYDAGNGSVYLMASIHQGGFLKRYQFHCGDETSSFPTAALRDAYIKMINDAAGEEVAVAI